MQREDDSSTDLTDATLTPDASPRAEAKPLKVSEEEEKKERPDVQRAPTGLSVYATPAEAPGFLFDRARTSRSVPLASQTQQDTRDAERKERNNNQEENNKERESDIVGWDGPDDPENPQNFSATRKWLLTLLLSLLTLNVTFASSSPSTVTEAIATQFGLTVVQSQLVTAVFLWGYCLGPFCWSASSEIFGRRKIFIIAMLGYVLFILGQPLARNPQTFFVTRFLSGVFASAPLTNAGGAIADIHDSVGRGPAMSLFVAAVFVGPSLGPIVGSYIVQEWRWEGVFWVLLAFSGCCWILVVFFLPETFAPVLLAKKAKRLRKQDPEKYKNSYAEHEKSMQQTGALGVVKKTVVTPFKIISLELILILITVYLSIAYAVLYALFEAFPVVFRDIHGLSMGLSSLPFLAVLVGALIGSVLNVFLNARYRHLQHLWRGSPPPEERLYGAIIAGPLLVAGSFAFGWAGYKASISLWGPTISAIALGASITLVFISLQAFIIDTYGAYSASALAANTICRSAVAGAFPLFTTQFFKGVGVNWASSIIGWVALALAPVPLVFYLYGPRLRKTGSRYAPCQDLKIRTELEENGTLPKDSYRALWGEARTGIEEARKQLAEQERRQKEGESKEQA
ncbi:hypothetical protein OC844_002990 [Tilletia horrida]|nr:hypothetical protein OC844_002990 [Tilletia horrida]